jgi:hypothetical protein
LAHEAAPVLLLWDPFSTGVEAEWLCQIVSARGLRQIVLVFASTALEPRLSGSVIQFGSGGAATAPRGQPVPRQGSLWVGAEPVDVLARQLVQQPHVVGAEILIGQPGLLCVGIAREPASAVPDTCAALLSIARSHDVGILGIRYEPEGTP